MRRLPNFLIIGAMKSATSTLYEQLQQLPGIYLPQLKEPNFFSNDEQFARGLDWYAALFEQAAPSDILGEASTHYTKLPTYPHTVARIRDNLAEPRLIYVMRHPVDRLISQYIHQWSEGEIHSSLDEAIKQHPELTEYSFYSRQLEPFFDSFGKKTVLPVFFDRLLKEPESELARVCKFIGYSGAVKWEPELSRRNISAERVRRFPLYDLLILHPIAEKLRRSLVPKAVRTGVRQFLSINKRPKLGEATRQQLEALFDKDLATLGRWLGIELNCGNFHSVTAARSLDWS